MPAAVLPRLALKHNVALIIINLQPTSLDSLADVVIAEKAGLVLPILVEML
jgi:NAD-dependent deacetylase